MSASLRTNTCHVCRSISGEAPISPAPPIFDGRFWRLEHAYPTRLSGWLVIILKRHAEALHELSSDEFAELAYVQAQAVRALHLELDCRKEYLAFFAEKDGFAHLHIHVVPRAQDLPEDLRGAKIFAMLQTGEAQAVPPHAVAALCDQLRSRFEALR